MEITAIVHSHGDPETTFDTIESIRCYMTDQVLLLIDEAGWKNFSGFEIPVPFMRGLYHGFPKAPYRNISLGLLHAYKNWPNSDWYFYTEYDALIGSNYFMKDLEEAKKRDLWICGNDYRVKQEDRGKKSVKLELIELMIKDKFKEIFYLLGAVLFYNKKFMKKLMDENFLEKLLYYTNDFQDGFFPGYEGPAAWDLIEHLMPTMAKHWGGNIGQFAKWSDRTNSWVDGNFRRYPVRWQPEIFKFEEYANASIIHPCKKFNSPLRIYHRGKRKIKCS